MEGCAASRSLRCYNDEKNSIKLTDTCLNLSWVKSAIGEIVDQRDFTINIHPNPTNDKISLGFEAINYQTKVIIVDVMGKKVFEKDFSKNATLSIDVAELKSGVYFVRLPTVDDLTIGSGSFIRL